MPHQGLSWGWGCQEGTPGLGWGSPAGQDAVSSPLSASPGLVPERCVMLPQGSPPRRRLPTSSGSRCPPSRCWPRPSRPSPRRRRGARGPPSSSPKPNLCPRASSRGGSLRPPPATCARGTTTTASRARRGRRAAAAAARSPPAPRAAPAGTSSTTGTSPSNPSPP